MKILTSIFLLSICNLISSQNFKIIKPDIGDSCIVIDSKTDTINNFERLIYIDNRRNTPFKRKINNIKYSEADYKTIKITYNKSIGSIPYNQPVEKLLIPKKWIRLYQYEGKWILFDDNSFVSMAHITDSSIIERDVEGCFSHPITEITKTGTNYNITHTGVDFFDPDKRREFKLIIHMIDKKTKVAVWEFLKYGRSQYILMVPVENISKFNVFHTSSSDGSIPGKHYFDHIDYVKLITD